MICQDCGVEAATKYVSFHQNIGAFIVRFPKSVEGYLCKSCIHKHFWSMTAITMTVGWWGTISLIVTPFFVLNNIGRYLFCLGMPGVGADATRPHLSDDVVDKIQPHAGELFRQLNAGEDLDATTRAVALVAGVTPGQVLLYVQAVVRAQQEQQGR